MGDIKNRPNQQCSCEKFREVGPEYMHIIISGNPKVMPGLELLIYSTMLHNKKVIWHLFTMTVDVDMGDGSGVIYDAISERDADWLRKIVKFMDTESDLIRYDVIDIYNQTIANSPNRVSTFTPYTGLRLLADLVLPDLDSAMYLDSDIIVQGDLRPPYHKYRWDPEVNYAAYTLPDACDCFGEITGGVLVFNLNKCRQSGFLKKARYYYNLNRYRWMDQEALRDAGTPAPLEETYNYMKDIKLATYKPVCVHFCCDNKFKIYSVQQGMFYRYYPEFLYLKEGIDIIKEVWRLR